jgi:hypothetical protein
MTNLPLAPEFVLVNSRACALAGTPAPALGFSHRVSPRFAIANFAKIAIPIVDGTNGRR